MTKAILFANEKSPSEFDPIFKKIYGLTVLERTLHALEKAEVLEIIIVAGGNLERVNQLLSTKKPEKIQVQVVDKATKTEKDTLYIREPLVVSPNVLKEVIEQQGRTADLKIIFHAKKLENNTVNTVFTENDSIDIIDTANEICTPIHTNAQLKITKKALIKSLTKPTDGWVSRNLNRPISTLFSRVLAYTSLTPNQFTILTGLIGLATGYFMAVGGYWNWLIGAFLFHATSVLDGVDGELARLKFKSSPFGQWLDTLVDNLSYVVGLGGLIIGVANHDWPSGSKIAGIAAVIFALLALGSLYLYLLRFGKGGTLLNVEYSFQEGKTTFDKVMQVLAALGKRDLFALIFFIMAIFGQLPLALTYVAIMTVAIFGFSLQAHATAAKKV